MPASIGTFNRPIDRYFHLPVPGDFCVSLRDRIEPSCLQLFDWRDVDCMCRVMLIEASHDADRGSRPLFQPHPGNEPRILARVFYQGRNPFLGTLLTFTPLYSPFLSSPRTRFADEINTVCQIGFRTKFGDLPTRRSSRGRICPLVMHHHTWHRSNSKCLRCQNLGMVEPSHMACVAERLPHTPFQTSHWCAFNGEALKPFPGFHHPFLMIYEVIEMVYAPQPGFSFPPSEYQVYRAIRR